MDNRNAQFKLAYGADVDQSNWDEQAERLMFALNTSFDAARLDTPFYLVHGWDAHGTISAMLGPKPSTVQEQTALEWRRKMQRDYSYALACAELLAKEGGSCEICCPDSELSDRVKAGFEADDSVWLYIPKIRTGLSRKLAHLWHGPFRIDEIHNDFRVKLKIPGPGCRVNPWVHIKDDDFDETLLSEDNWEPNSAQDEYEVEDILDLRWIKCTRASKRSREYFFKWKGYTDPDWIPLAQLNCEALLYQFDQDAKARARFQAMQAGGNPPGK
ncbi:hypothetical protein PHMEG_00010353 [Phytophthora megakarya]|uniref:Chromo domain-containing protein n=1 Tax=Phytophthora megakarya TaxID=4795 RepID=A0A225WGD3_9STRA|nr:hypothetical protein PHMEG_00010353 [Phytophthora megakarya]